MDSGLITTVLQELSEQHGPNWTNWPPPEILMHSLWVSVSQSPNWSRNVESIMILSFTCSFLLVMKLLLVPIPRHLWNSYAPFFSSVSHLTSRITWTIEKAYNLFSWPSMSCFWSQLCTWSWVILRSLPHTSTNLVMCGRLNNGSNRGVCLLIPEACECYFIRKRGLC